MCPVTYCLAVPPTGHAGAAWPMAPCHAALRPIGSCGLAVQMPVFIVGGAGGYGRAIHVPLRVQMSAVTPRL